MSNRPRAGTFIVVFFLLALTSPAATPQILPPGAAAATPASVQLKADTQELVEKGHYRATGLVDLRSGDLHVQADVLDYYETEAPGLPPARRVIAEGNVVLLRGEERLAGDHLELDLVTGRGTFTRASGFVQPGVFVEAEKLERLDAANYRVEGATFTSCSQSTPTWNFKASSARIHVDHKIAGRNVVFAVKSVPAFYAPYFIYPIHRDQRSTGFLLPSVARSDTGGLETRGGFFWAMGRSADQTFHVERFSKLGTGFGHELRYVEDGPSHGDFSSYVMRQRDARGVDYSVELRAVQALPARFTSTLDARLYSRTAFLGQIHDDLERATNRKRQASLSLQGKLGRTQLLALVDTAETAFKDDASVLRHLPALQLTRFPGRIGRTPLVFGLFARAEELEQGTTQGGADQVFGYSRLEVAPALSLTRATRYLRVTPRVEAGYLRYGRSISNPLALAEGAAPEYTGAPLDRLMFEGSVEVRGPAFARVFENPGGWYSKRFKHEVAPVLKYRYQTPVDQLDSRRTPKTGARDFAVGTNEVQYGIEQSLAAKRPGLGGRETAHTFLTWQVFQTYHIDSSRGQSLVDPGYTSSPFTGPPRHGAPLSPVRSVVQLVPSRRFRSDFTLEYDVRHAAATYLDLHSTLDLARVDLTGGWSRSVDLANAAAPKNTLWAQGGLELLPGRLRLDGAATFDALEQHLVDFGTRLTYHVQCCGFAVHASRSQIMGLRVGFSIELANVGSVGHTFDSRKYGASP